MGINGKIANQVRYILDAAGKIIGYKNPTSDADEAFPSDAVQALVSGDRSAPYAIGLGLFGDSITQRGFYNSNDSGVSGWYIDGALDNFSRTIGWASFVGPMSMQRIQIVKSWARAANGLLETGTGYPISVQVTAALADPLWSKVTRAVFLVGTNDTEYSIEACTAELLSQIGRLGKPVDLIAIPPTSGSTATSGNPPLPYWAWVLEWRATLKRIADESGGAIRFIDGYTALANPTTSPATWASGMQDDGTHPNNVGSYLIADAYVKSLIPTGIDGDLDIWTHNSSAASTNCALLDQGFLNPVFATASGGTGTGVIAGSLAVTNLGGGSHSGSVSASTIPGSTGNMQTLAITSGTVADGVSVAFTSFHAAGTQFLTAGDRAWAQCLVRINSGGIYPRNIFWRLQGIQGATNWAAVWGANDTASELAFPLTAPRTFLLRTPVLLTPSGAAFSDLTMRMLVRFAGAGTCTIDIANAETRRFKSGGVYA